MVYVKLLWRLAPISSNSSAVFNSIQFSLLKSIYTVFGLKLPLYFCRQFCQILIDFQNSLTRRLSNKFTVKSKVLPYSLPSVGPGADPGVQAVSPQVTISHPPDGRLPLLSARSAVTFPAAENHRPLTGTKLHCLLTEAHRCEQLAQGCYAAFAPIRSWRKGVELTTCPSLYPLRHRATH